MRVCRCSYHSSCCVSSGADHAEPVVSGGEGTLWNSKRCPAHLTDALTATLGNQTVWCAAAVRIDRCFSAETNACKIDRYTLDRALLAKQKFARVFGSPKSHVNASNSRATKRGCCIRVDCRGLQEHCGIEGRDKQKSQKPSS
jgi:hypothetical protein